MADQPTVELNEDAGILSAMKTKANRQLLSLSLSVIAVAFFVAGSGLFSLAVHYNSWVMGCVSLALGIATFVLIPVSNRLYRNGR